VPQVAHGQPRRKPTALIIWNSNSIFGSSNIWKTVNNVSVLLRLDNITVIAFINKMGGFHSLLSNLAVEIWTWCIHRKITIHAEHLPGVENVQADWQSHHLQDCSDWKLLHTGVFQNL